MEFSRKHKHISIFLACIQNMTLGGVFYGWASISGSLLTSSAQQGGPGLSSDYVHMIFVIASFCNFLGPLVLGIILDTYGPRACSVVSIFLIAVGSAMFAASGHDSLPLFIPGMCLIAFGGPGTQSAIIHLSNLFPEWKATATSFIVGSFQLSFVVFLIFDTLWSTMNISYITLFTGYAVICAVNVLISLLIWPDVPYSLEDTSPELAELEEELEHSPTPRAPTALIHMSRIRLPSVMVHKPHGAYAEDDQHHTHHRHHHHHHNHQQSQGNEYQALPNLQLEHPSEIAAVVPAENDMCLKDASFNEQILSPEFFWLTFFFLVNSFCMNFYIGTFDMQLGDKHDLTATQRHAFADSFTLVITLGVVAIPVVGALMDRTGFPATSSLCIGCGVIWELLLLADSPERHLLMLSFVFYSVYRTAFFTFFFAYLADVLGFRFFGMLGGIIFLLAGVAGMLQYPLAKYAAGDCHVYSTNPDTCDKGRWALVNAVMLFAVVSTFYFTYLDYVRRKAQAVAAGALDTKQVELTKQSYGSV